MPNWVENRLSYNGNETEIKGLRKSDMIMPQSEQ